MSELASGIVSTALQCGTGRCPTDDLQLDTPVRITVEHSENIKVVANLFFHCLSMLLIIIGTT